MRLLLAGVGLSLLGTSFAWAGGNSFVLPDGTNRAPAMALHCVTSNGAATPCGIAGNPLVVSAPAGGSSSAYQQQQIGAEQATSQALGTTADSNFNGGNGSVIAVLKALWSATSGGVSALPAGGQLTSHTISLPGSSSLLVFSANPGRHYLSFQVPQNTGVWVNVVGGLAAPNGADCAYFGPGTFYESGTFVNRGAISVYAPMSVLFSAWEG